MVTQLLQNHLSGKAQGKPWIQLSVFKKEAGSWVVLVFSTWAHQQAVCQSHQSRLLACLALLSELPARF